MFDGGEYSLERVDGQCIGHWKPHVKHDPHYIPRGIYFKDREPRKLSFLYTMVGKDPDSPDKEYYYFRCYDVTSGPSEEEVIWKVEPQVAAQIFEHFLQRYFDLIVTRVGTKYYFRDTST